MPRKQRRERDITEDIRPDPDLHSRQDNERNYRGRDDERDTEEPSNVVTDGTDVNKDGKINELDDQIAYYSRLQFDQKVLANTALSAVIFITIGIILLVIFVPSASSRLAAFETLLVTVLFALTSIPATYVGAKTIMELSSPKTKPRRTE